MDPAAHATADRGAITIPEPLQNTYTSDATLHRVLAWYLPSDINQSIQPNLTQLGEEAISPQIREWSADAERNQPYVKSYNVWGQRYDYDRLVTSEGWKQLGRWGARHGVVAIGYEPTYGASRRLVQYAVNYLYSPSSGLTSCPAAMTDGAALILSQQLQQHSYPADHPFRAVYARLISRTEDCWTSGQWMTERAGGSDVQNTETWATYSPLPSSSSSSDALSDGAYTINGFKFFSSATDANVTLLLAKTSPSGKLSTFLAPLRRTIPIPAPTNPQTTTTKQVANGVRIHRLKNKLGTKELPTAELELHGMRAHLVGEPEKGVATIAPLLNVTRTHTFIGSLGAWRRALSIAKAFARARSTVGEPLWLIPMHLRLLAELEARHRAALQVGFFTVAVMGAVENPADGGEGSARPAAHVPRGREATVVFRALTAAAKAVVSKMAVLGIQECQEALGGVGYMDEADEPEFNVARLLRNTAVNSIWEGTTNVLASELVRFLLARDHFAVFAGWMERVLGLLRAETAEAAALRRAWLAFRARIAGDVAAVLADGRRVMFTLAWILAGALLVLDAQRDGDAVAGEVARRWVLAGEGGVGDTVFREVVRPSGEGEEEKKKKNHAQWDCRIVWGMELPEGQVAGHRSLKHKL
ncbi:putative acyl-CoA dehydrogenase [Aspergillus clavatus NRRL 1]|uniref:Acyl-CoA dehydrogenase, C-terminal domain protein n=1 Tax=Aspergillus clavatus (strain ATCC 1007 / CBS 513.65 / DSM 816 / NCTC 3887 / NRRL 1 / QM 1276 / 107) TaxID=344612 RepID=A1CAW3_ASPCL|nr:Acyl-CoA dehydrogenase, C-terminal domain protein [Aspergillus clavatus NRRL 1]EAW12881.1 Acyl-CoA dehydrogenase, C-terminal domain protein [Aspergillus clavatus NRRL 1]